MPINLLQLFDKAHTFIRLQLAGGNPWLNQDDRRAARRAVESAYAPPTTAVQPAGARDRTRPRQPARKRPVRD